MNNKGLTLVELLAVFMVLTILGTITFVSVISRIEDANEKSEMVLISSIEHAAEMYVLENRYDFEEETYMISVQSLIDEGYLREENLQNPLTKEDIDTATLVEVQIGANNKIVVTYNLNQ